MRRLVLVVLALIAGVTAFHFVPEPLPELTRAELMAEIQAGHVRSIEIQDQDTIIAESSTRGQFRSGFDRHEDSSLVAELRAIGVEVLFSTSAPGL